MAIRKKTDYVYWSILCAILVALLVIGTILIRREYFTEEMDLFIYSETPQEPNAQYPVVLYQFANYTGYSIALKLGTYTGTSILTKANRRSMSFASVKFGWNGRKLLINNVVGQRKSFEMKASGPFPSPVLVNDPDSIVVSWEPTISGNPVAVLPRESNGSVYAFGGFPFGLTLNGIKYEDNLAETIWAPEGFVLNGVRKCDVPANATIICEKFIQNTTGADMNVMVLLAVDDYGSIQLQYADGTTSPWNPNRSWINGKRLVPLTIPKDGAIVRFYGRNKGDAGCAGIRGAIFKQTGELIAHTDASWVYNTTSIGNPSLW